MTDLERMLIEQEGTGPLVNGRFMPYKDSVGISQDEAILLFKDDIANAANDARRLCSIFDELTRPRQLVLMSMAFNLGYAGFSKWPRFWDAIHRRDWQEASDQILDSKAARQDAPARYRQLARMMRDDFSSWV